jgi:hypothetical protein
MQGIPAMEIGAATCQPILIGPIIHAMISNRTAADPTMIIPKPIALDNGLNSET